MTVCFHVASQEAAATGVGRRKSAWTLQILDEWMSTVDSYCTILSSSICSSTAPHPNLLLL